MLIKSSMNPDTTVPNKNTASTILVGHISKAHGVKGEVALVLYAESPDLLSGEVFLQKDPASPLRPIAIEKTRSHHGGLLVTFAKVHDRNAADLLRGCSVLVPRDKLPPLDEGDAYLADMLGLTVLVYAPDDTGGPAALGVLTGVDAPAGQELWAVTTPEGKEVLMPAVPEFVLDIDLDAGTVTIDPPPGLLELYLGT